MSFHLNFQFRPKLLDTLPGYGRDTLMQDVSAGITVGVLSLPLAMAFAIASGASPAAGIWTAIIAGFLTSLLGGSRVQIGGPTGAFIPILYAIIADFSFHELLIATMMSGIVLFTMGALRVGGMIRFIPLTVVLGFTNGIAVVLFITQIKDFLGLPIDNMPGEFFARLTALGAALPHFDPFTLAVALVSLAILVIWNRQAGKVDWMRRFPGPLAVLTIMTLANGILDLPVATIGSRFNGIPQSLPEIAFPDLNLSNVGKLIMPALAISMLGAIESLLSARVADSQIDDRHDSNQELMAQGIANFVAPLFGGIASTGAMARTATNIRSGARTPVAGCVHALVLLLIVLLLAPLASHIPLATLSAIVVIVAVNMGQWRTFAPRELARYSNSYRAILLTTFFVTVVFDLTLALELGMVLASLAFIFRMARLTRIDPVALAPADAAISAYRLSGSLFFGAINKLETLLTCANDQTRVLILDLEGVINIDTTALDILQSLLRSLHKTGASLILCSVGRQPASLLSRSGFDQQPGVMSIATDFTAALEQARERCKT
ncbi:sodium-independent anion transporter [Betaproteobacteria bacterium]|nr:sodium-independent anion transporter [Betaproteobacteria bacterium]GHU31472.1 sodium-independent anion transporter [Betaproteobacteria bacterium]